MNPNENQAYALTELATVLDKEYQAAAALASEMENELSQIRRRYLPKIRSVVNKCADAQVALQNGIVDSDATLWEKKKTMTQGVVKFGWRKQKGKVEIDNEPDCINRLRRALGDTVAAQYINTKETVAKEAVRKLTVAQATAAGIKIDADVDEVTIKNNSGEALKTLEAIFKDSTQDE